MSLLLTDPFGLRDSAPKVQPPIPTCCGYPPAETNPKSSRSSAIRSQIVADILWRRPTRRQKKRQMLTTMDFALANGLLPSPLRSPLSLLVGAAPKCLDISHVLYQEAVVIGVDSLGFDLRICSGRQVQTQDLHSAHV
ncbi:hypothetical protein B296_00052078 [Ensete ventricosum]|uniref:Uncharacterized protein n=1 Tax=Ensete ventricosum TaxID=4639 RepID=A0A426YDR9_ENSVE|nr:hypothetical protein B296_00052078 [Ensete ventricosum]